MRPTNVRCVSYTKFGKNTTEIYKMIKTPVFGNNFLCRSKIFKWFKHSLQSEDDLHSD